MVIDEIVLGITRNQRGRITRVGIMSEGFCDPAIDPRTLTNGILILPTKDRKVAGSLSFDALNNGGNLEIVIESWVATHEETNEVIHSVINDQTLMLGAPRLDHDIVRTETVRWYPKAVRVFHGLWDYYQTLSEDEIGGLPPGWAYQWAS